MSIWQGMQHIAEIRAKDRARTIAWIQKGGPDFYKGMFKVFCYWTSVFIAGFLVAHFI